MEKSTRIFRNPFYRKVSNLILILLALNFGSGLFAQDRANVLVKTALQNQENEFVPDEIIIQFTASVADQIKSASKRNSTITGLQQIDALNSKFGVKSIEQAIRFVDSPKTNMQLAEKYGLSRIYVLKVQKGSDIKSIAQEYENNHAVVFAEPNYIDRLTTAPNDPMYPSQWGLKNTGQAVSYTNTVVGTPGADINIEPAWTLHTGDESVILAIIDSGLDYLHPEFVGRVVPGYDIYNNDSDPMDDGNHGTACAGIAAASGNNGIGVAGVNWNCKIMPVKIFPASGGTSTANVANGIIWAADHGADVLSCSFGGSSASNLRLNAVNYAYDLGCTIVASRGNNDNNNASYPASYANVIAVGALSPCNERKTTTTCDGESWWGSSYGNDLDVMAPGSRIHTTDRSGSVGYSNTDYTSSFNGTSAACPFVAGVAALICSYAPNLTNAEIANVLNITAVDIDASGFDDQTGYGRVNAFAALNFAATYAPCANPTTGGSIASEQTICYNGDPAELTSSAVPTGHTGTLEYQWQSSSDNITFTNLTTGTYTATTYDPDALTVTTWYKRLARVGCKTDWIGAAESDVVKITVNTPIRFVTNTGAGSKSGNSWANAYDNTQLQQAINDVCATQVWVATGTYKPTQDPFGNSSPADPRDKTFYLKDGVAIYGGFAGTGIPGFADRDWILFETALSGDFNNNDVITGSGSTLSITGNGENAYHVVLSVSDAATTILDGFTVSGGNANGGASIITVESQGISREGGGGMHNVFSFPNITNTIFTGNFSPFGGGMYNTESSPGITNTTFTGNSSNYLGGGMHNRYSSSPNIINTTFNANSATTGGGGMYNFSCSPIITNTTFTSNSAPQGGGMSNSYSYPTITNTTFTGNSANFGGGMYSDNFTLYSISNTTFTGNSASSGGGGMYNNFSTTNPSRMIRNSIFWGNGTEITNNSSTPVVSYSIVQGGYSGTGNLNADPLFVNAANPTGLDGIHRTAEDGISIQSSSPAINAGDAATTTPATDITGFTRTGVFDMGAYENQNPCRNPSLRGTISANQSGCNPFDSDEITVSDPTGNVGTLEYQWQVSSDNISFTNLSTGTYTATTYSPDPLTVSTWYRRLVKVTCESVWASSDTVKITINQLPTANASVAAHVSCFGGNTGSVDVSVSGGQTAYSYLWSTNPAQTAALATALSSGTYSVTVTDANGCKAYSSAEITQPTSTLSAAANVVQHVNCYGSNTGSVEVSVSGGTTAYGYEWSTNPIQSLSTASGLSAGTYMVTVTDGNGCTATSSAIVTQPDALTATASVVSNVSIYEGSDGSVTVTLGGGTTDYSYKWSTNPEQTTQTATGLTVGAYTVIVTDGNSCTATSSISLTQPTPPTVQVINLILTDVGSNQAVIDWTRGNSDGCAVFIREGITGLAPPTNNVSYPANTVFGTSTSQVGTSGWYCIYDGTGTNVTVTGLLPLTEYRVHICEYKLGSKTYNTSSSTNNPSNFTTFSSIAATASVVNNVSCFGLNNGSASVSVSGGNPPYSYFWSSVPAQSAQSATGLSAGNYTVTVTDGASTSITASVSITQPIQWWPELNGPTPVCQNSTGNVYTTDLGMTNYTWLVSAGGTITSGGSGTDNIVTITWTGFGPQTISVNYTNPAGCVAVAPKVKNVMVNIAPTPAITGEANVTQSQVETYETAHNPGNTYSWNASHGNPELCFPNRNCLTLIWDFPCGIVNPGYVRVTETNTSTGCSTTVTKWITIAP